MDEFDEILKGEWVDDIKKIITGNGELVLHASATYLALTIPQKTPTTTTTINS